MPSANNAESKPTQADLEAQLAELQAQLAAKERSTVDQSKVMSFISSNQSGRELLKRARDQYPKDLILKDPKVRDCLKKLFIFGNPRTKTKPKKPEDQVGYNIEQLKIVTEEASKAVSPEFPLRFDCLSTNFLNVSPKQLREMRKETADADCIMWVMTYSNAKVGIPGSNYTTSLRVTFKVYRDEVCS